MQFDKMSTECYRINLYLTTKPALVIRKKKNAGARKHSLRYHIAAISLIAQLCSPENQVIPQQLENSQGVPHSLVHLYIRLIHGLYCVVKGTFG